MPNIIDSIQISSSTFDVRDKSATTVVNLTQDEYDSLPSSAKTANVLYNITDASPIDISQYWTSAQTNSAINQAVSGKANSNDVYLKTETSGVTQLNTAFENKQDTLVSGFNIKTINNESILGGGNIDIQGGGIDSGTVQTMIDESISGKTNQSDFTAHTANTTVHVTSAEKATWNAKSDFSGNYNDLSNKPTIPTSASQLTNDSGYITSSALDGYATEAYVTAATNDMATKTWVGQQGYLTQHQDISGKQDVSGMTAYTTTATTNTLSGTVTAHTANTTIHVTAQDKTNWNNKSDFSGDYNDLANKPTIPTVPTNVSDFTNDAGYITVNDITGKTNQTDFVSHSGNTTMHVTASEKSTWNNKSDFSGNYNDLSNKPTIPSKTSDLTNDSGFATTGDVQTATADMATKTWVGQQGYLTQHQDISGKQDVSGMTAYTETSAFTAHTADTTIHVTSTEKSTWNAKSDFSGSYNDLTDKPTIPTVPTSNTAFTNDAGYITIDAISGKVDTTTFNTYSGNVETALSGKQDTLSAGTGIDITDNVISATGGGSTYTAGRGIKIDTANTISLVPVVYSSTGASSLVVNSSTNKAAEKAFAEGSGTKANGLYSHAEGLSTTATGQQSHVEGYNTIAKNNSEHASGSWNVSSTGSTTADKTLFSVGNGTAENARHNAFEIRQNGDIYITLDGQDVKLQDHLGGGSSYTAGSGIDITNDVISVTGKVDTTTFNTYSGNVETALSGKQDTLSAGTGIDITDNVISATGGGGKAVSAGTNISITTGETADTINCTLPIFIHSNSGRGDIRIGTDIDANSDYYRLGIGRRIHMSSSYGSGSIAIGVAGTGSNQYNLCYGDSNVGIGRLFEIGESNTSSGVKSECVVIGNKAKSLISKGVAIGSQTTVSGTTQTNINNQLKIDTSNQVYIYNKDNTEMICLQDQLGGGGSSYTAGDGIDITNDVISVTGKVDTSAFTAHTADTVIHVTSAEKATWDAKSDFSGSYNDLTDKPTIPTVPTSNTAFTNDAGYITSSALDGYATTATTSALNNTLTAHTADTTVHTTAAEKTSWNGAVTNASNAVTALGGLKLVKLTQAQYDALATKDSNTLYVING